MSFQGHPLPQVGSRPHRSTSPLHSAVETIYIMHGVAGGRNDGWKTGYLRATPLVAPREGKMPAPTPPPPPSRSWPARLLGSRASKCSAAAKGGRTRPETGTEATSGQSSTLEEISKVLKFGTQIHPATLLESTPLLGPGPARCSFLEEATPPGRKL